MAVKIKGFEEISILFPGNEQHNVLARLNAYKWYKIVQICKIGTYLASSIFGILEILARIFVV